MEMAQQMPRYVPLLRGINVGRRNRVAMADLRQVTAALGHGDVSTYIQSGNLLFSSPQPAPASSLTTSSDRSPNACPCSPRWSCCPATNSLR